jgi:hypothetical protein
VTATTNGCCGGGGVGVVRSTLVTVLFILTGLLVNCGFVIKHLTFGRLGFIKALVVFVLLLLVVLFVFESTSICVAPKTACVVFVVRVSVGGLVCSIVADSIVGGGVVVVLIDRIIEPLFDVEGPLLLMLFVVVRLLLLLFRDAIVCCTMGAGVGGLGCVATATGLFETGMFIVLLQTSF